MKLIDLYPYCIVQSNPQFLLLKRSIGVLYANEWRMIGGKVDDSETHSQAALRELYEETGLKPDVFWVIPSINSFFDHRNDTIHHIPAFACEIAKDAVITLNHEHTEFGWFEFNKAKELISWPEQQRLILLVNEILTTTGINSNWIITP